MTAWEQLCRPGDSEDEVRAALLDEFDTAWLAIARSIRDQLRAQGATLAVALAAAEQARAIFRAEQGDMAPQILDRMAAGVSPQH